MHILYLYHTSGCHLCEQAKSVISGLLDARGVRIEEVDIAESDELIERYGVRIPVLKIADQTSELGWPFNAAQAACYLDQALHSHS
jgi:glutaredoxin